MIPSKAVVAVALALIAASGPRDANGRTRDSTVVPSGCFALEIGDWSRPVASDGLPDTIRLDTARAYVTPESKDWRVLSPTGNADRAYWLPRSGNSVWLVWEREREFHVSIRATVEGSALRGVATGSMYEHLTPEPTAPVRGHRVEC